MTDHKNAWELILRRIAAEVSKEDFRRWFGATAYASDTTDQITVWVPSEAIRRHIDLHYRDAIDRALAALGRDHTQIRFLVAGFFEEDDEEES